MPYMVAKRHNLEQLFRQIKSLNMMLTQLLCATLLADIHTLLCLYMHKTCTQFTRNDI